MPAPYFAADFGNLNHCAVETACRIASDGRMKERLQMVLLSMEGRHAPEIAHIVHRTPETVLTWLHKWNESGFEGLRDRPHSGRPPVLTPDEQAVTVKWVKEQAESGRRPAGRFPFIYLKFFLKKLIMTLSAGCCTVTEVHGRNPEKRITGATPPFRAVS